MQNDRAISRLRVLIGYLGERHAANWWPSSFLDRTSDAFMGPIFGDAIANARMAGVTEAARRVHDNAIGIGRTFHLFRLPETIEQELHRTLSASKDTVTVESRAAATEELMALSSGGGEVRAGPVHVGALEMLTDARWVPAVASYYCMGFAAGVQSFPYFAG